jgi:uncharacterized integral membrane protein
MATRVSKITGFFLLLIINLATSCNKNKLVYYTPSNASKQSVALAEINKVDVVDLILIDTINRIDSPITNDTEKNKAILKKYSFGDETIQSKQEKKEKQEVKAINKNKGRYTVLIIGIVILAIGLLWFLYASTRTSLQITSSIFTGCLGVLLSLILSIIGLVTTIVGLFTT